MGTLSGYFSLIFLASSDTCAELCEVFAWLFSTAHTLARTGAGSVERSTSLDSRWQPVS